MKATASFIPAPIQQSTIAPIVQGISAAGSMIASVDKDSWEN